MKYGGLIYGVVLPLLYQIPRSVTAFFHIVRVRETGDVSSCESERDSKNIPYQTVCMAFRLSAHFANDQLRLINWRVEKFDSFRFVAPFLQLGLGW